MSKVNIHQENTFCWADLVTTDCESAKNFYTTLFNWTAVDVPAGDNTTYTMLQKAGKNVCALYSMDPEMRKQGMPSFWQSYVSVTNVDDVSDKVAKLGGKVLMPPFDILDFGRMAMLEDPSGATLSIWQANQHIGAELINETATMCWNELYTKDPTAATEFYSTLFGWTVHKTTGAIGEEYNEFKMGDRSVAGMLEITPNWSEVPPHWAVYFAVEDCESALEKVKSLGGSIESDIMEIPDMARFAVAQDPQGAHFLVLQSLT